MNSVRIQFLILSLFLIPSNGLRAEVGEFTLSEALLKQLQLTSSKNQPFKRDGRLIEPNLAITVTPTLVDSNSTVGIDLNINLKGTSRTHSTTPVTRKRSVEVVVDSNVEADFKQGITLGNSGIETGDFKGDVNIQTNNIRASNNFRLLNGAVNKKALEKAPSSISSELPQEKLKLERQVLGELETGTNVAKRFFKETMDSLNLMFPDSKGIAFDSRFTSTTGEKGQIKFEAIDKDKTKQRSSKPTFENGQQILAQGVFHQDLLTEIVSSEIAGKEMKIAQLKKILCSPKLQKIINFCSIESSAEADSLSLVFDEKEPIQFIFENGKVNLKLKAAYRTGVPKITNSDVQLLNTPGQTKAAFETVPYEIEIGYDVKEGEAKLTKMAVKELSEQTGILGFAFDRLLGKKNHADNQEQKGRPSTEGLLSPFVKKKIESELDKMLAKEIDFNSVSIPTKVKMQGTPDNRSLVVNEAGSLLPIQVKSEDGWLAVGSTFCTSGQKALGVTFDSPGLIKSVDPMSPAQLTGFKEGDRIETFGELGGRSHAFGSGYESFLSFIAEKAANNSSAERKVEVVGKDASGKSFKRVVFLCPTQINHLERVRQGLAQAKQK